MPGSFTLKNARLICANACEAPFPWRFKGGPTLCVVLHILPRFVSGGALPVFGGNSVLGLPRVCGRWLVAAVSVNPFTRLSIAVAPWVGTLLTLG
jgi:hypothetical protein